MGVQRYNNRLDGYSGTATAALGKPKVLVLYKLPANKNHTPLA